jgi:hypothetical protein
MRKIAYGAAVLLSFLMTPGVRAQGVAGTWQVNYDMRIERTGGEDVVTERGKATLTLTQKGDSVSGSWVVTAGPPGRPVPPPRAVKGTFRSGTLNFSGDPVAAQIMQNGESSSVMMLQEYEGTLSGDALKGTFTAHSMDGSIQAGTRNWDATRTKS